MSVLSLIIAVVAAFFFYRGDHLSLITGALIFHMSHIPACSDGYIARESHECSTLGHWLDHTFAEINKPILLISL